MVIMRKSEEIRKMSEEAFSPDLIKPKNVKANWMNMHSLVTRRTKQVGIRLASFQISDTLLANVRRWIKIKASEGVDPLGYIDYIITNWKAICSVLRKGGYSYVWVRDDTTFDMIVFFNRPEYRKIIEGAFHSLSHMAVKSKAASDKPDIVDDLSASDFTDFLLR